MSEMRPLNESVLQQLGTKLWYPLQQEEVSPPSRLLANKVVLLYFSARWCGPCRRFTPLLKDLYTKLKARDHMEDFDVVLCCNDGVNEDEYKKYTKDMPWLCLPFRSPVFDKLSNRYSAVGVPHLVILDKDGSILHKDAINEVSADPLGDHFPWRPKPLVELLPNKYLGADKQLHPSHELDDKYLLLYFSASWCPPCCRFTPKLSNACLHMKEHRNDFEILFVSSDHDQDSFDRYLNEMTFAAIPFRDRWACASITKQLHVPGIPWLSIFGPRDMNGDRRLINSNIRCIFEEGSSDYLSQFPYEAKNYGDVNQTCDDIHSIKALIIFYEAGDDEEQGELEEVLHMAAENYNGTDGLRFFWAFRPTGLTKALREALKAPPCQDTPLMVLLDIPNQSSYYISNVTEISVEAVAAFVTNPGERRHV